MNIHDDPRRVVKLLCSAFQVMASSRARRANLPRCLPRFHREIDAVTFHPASSSDDADIYPTVDFDKFPSENTKTLVALEDLGRGSTGKAWLCVTLLPAAAAATSSSSSSSRSAACVLKFDNQRVHSSSSLESERNMWHLLYPELAPMVRLQRWAGADALVMPHCSAVLQPEREQFREQLRHVLTDKFTRYGKVHKDLRWCNIGKYVSSGQVGTIVIFDLHGLDEFDADKHSGWVDTAMLSLYAQG